MGRSFFAELQGWFKREYGAEHGGRFLALVIEHTFKADPAPFRDFLVAIFGGAFREKDLTLNRELVFKGRQGSRRADLAVVCNGEVRILIELKYRDRLQQPSGPKPAQLDDYLSYCQQNRGCRFLLLHREPQKSSEIRKIKSARQCLAHYARLAPDLLKSQHPASAMLYEYLQGEGLVLETIDADQLYRFLHRFMLPAKDSGRIVTSKVAEGPRQLQALLSNMRLFAADVTPQLTRATGRESARMATVDFYVVDRLSKTRLKKAIDEYPKDKYVFIGPTERLGGELSIWAGNTFSDGKNWLYAMYGFIFEVLPGKLGCQLYAELSSPELNRKGAGDLYAYERFDVDRLRDIEKANIDVAFIKLIRSMAKVTLRKRQVTEKFAVRTLQALAKL